MTNTESTKVSQWSAHVNGARAAHFSPENHITVNVVPVFEEQNERALAIASDLADHAAAIAARDAKIAKLEEHAKTLAREVANLSRRIPPDAPVRLLGVGFVRFVCGEPWVFNKRERGLGEFGFRCESWDDLFRRYDVRVVAHGKDQHGDYWEVENGGAP